MSAPTGPTLICYDGSDGSRNALHSVAHVLASKEMVVLTVWESLSTRLVKTSGFASVMPDNEGELDQEEEDAARQAAEDGARRAREQGFDATSRVEQATIATWRTIVDVADEIDAELIVTGTRGRGGVESLLLGSTSTALLRHAHRPLLIAPEPRPDA